MAGQWIWHIGCCCRGSSPRARAHTQPASNGQSVGSKAATVACAPRDRHIHFTIVIARQLLCVSNRKRKHNCALIGFYFLFPIGYRLFSKVTVIIMDSTWSRQPIEMNIKLVRLERCKHPIYEYKYIYVIHCLTSHCIISFVHMCSRPVHTPARLGAVQVIWRFSSFPSAAAAAVVFFFTGSWNNCALVELVSAALGNVERERTA